MTHRRTRSLWEVFRAPAVLAVLSCVGLLAALVGDGPYDALSWVALGVPVAVCAWAWAWRGRGARRRN